MTKNIYWIQAAEPHRVAIVARPRGGDWLDVDVQLLSREGIGVLVSMLTPDETAELGLSEEQQYCDQAGIRYINLPVVDRGIPDLPELGTVVEQLAEFVREGVGVGFHCRAGIGRSSLMAALVLARLGWTAEAAFRALSESRGCPVPDTEAQKRWVSEVASQGMLRNTLLASFTRLP